jgi:hypothetical protein
LPIVWGKIVSSVRKSDYIPVQDQYFDENGSLMRIMNYQDVKMFDNRKIPSVIELIPQNKENNKTVLRYLKASFNIKLHEDIFTLRNLRTPEF